MEAFVVREQARAITEFHIEDYKHACNLFTLLPEAKFDDGAQPYKEIYGDQSYYWTCHGLCIAFSKILKNWKVMHGHYVKYGTLHSWLYQTAQHDVIILDVYPVGGVAPQLLQPVYRQNLYIEDSLYYKEADYTKFRKESMRILKSLKGINAV